MRLEGVGELGALGLLAAAVRVRVARVKVGLADERLEPRVSVVLLPLQPHHRLGVAKHLTGGVHFTHLDQLEYNLLVEIG